MTRSDLVLDRGQLAGGIRGEGNFSVRSAIIVGLVWLALALLPLYTFASGGFQPVDIAIVLLAIAMLGLGERLWDGGLSQVGAVVLLYVAWMMGVEIVSFMRDSVQSHVLGMTQKLYAAVVFWTFTRAFVEILRSRWAIPMIFIGLLLAVGTAFLSSDGYGRMIGGYRGAMSFNNPIQLAYFSVLSVCAVLALIVKVEAHKIGTGMTVLGSSLVVLAHYLCFLSVTRSGMGALLVLDTLILVWLLQANRRIIYYYLGIGVLAGAVLWLAPFGLSEVLSEGRISLAMRRFEMGEISESLERRTVIAIGQYRGEDASFTNLLIGTGKPSTAVVGLKEVHNAFGETFVEGGVIGVFLLALLLGTMLAFVLSRSGSPRESLIHLGIFGVLIFYNFVQMGLRFRFFWIFLALWCATALEWGRSADRR